MMAITRVFGVVALIFGLATGPGLAETKPPLLNRVFQDHAVLQRDKPLHIWGLAPAGAVVAVTLSSASANTTADGTGRWDAVLPPLPAGGPFVLSATSNGETQAVSDILMGDVYLCSGQSNMGFPLRLASHYDDYIAEAKNPNLRFMRVPRLPSLVPVQDIAAPVTWSVTSPTTVPEFSAACYYFGRALQPVVNVPIGLVQSSWGGTNIESWLDLPSLEAVGGYEPLVSMIKDYVSDPVQGRKNWNAVAWNWWREHDPAAKADLGWNTAAFDDHAWPTTLATGPWEWWGDPALKKFDGIVWLRKTVTLTAAQAKGEATLSLGRLDDGDVTWVNGVLIGSWQGNDTKRRYTIPAGVLHEGDNLIAISVLDSGQVGGFLDAPAERKVSFADGSVAPLQGTWRYQVSADISTLGRIPRYPRLNQWDISSLYNGMIAPLGLMNLKGILWYQGEGNAAAHAVYGNLLRALIASWRHRFGQDVAFINTQLPGFGSPSVEPAQSNWAELREQQRLVAEGTPNSALAVTIDLGQRDDIHPPDKKNVGERLALAAEKLVYNMNVVASGPRPLTVERKGKKIAVTFDQALKIYEARSPIGFQICDSGTHCVFADASEKDGTILIDTAPMPAASTLRYCWSASPLCNLYNATGLPAAPFRLPIAPQIGRKPSH